MRTGLIAKKIGMSRYFTDEGQHVPVTILQTQDCQVTGVRTQDKDGYVAIQLGAFARKAKHTPKPQRMSFAKVKVEAKKHLAEFRVSEDAVLEIGQELTVGHFIPGQKVDVRGKNIGKGFQGGMKRHNFGGLEATHGVSISHRSHGSTGQCQEPGRVFKGKKMAGQMGNVFVTAQNLEVVATDEDRGLLFIKGAVPGSKGNILTITDAVKTARPENAPYPAGVKQTANAEVKEEKEEKAEAAENAEAAVEESNES